MRKDEFNSVVEAVDDGVQAIHVSGQPGIGKSTFLEELADELSDSYKTRILYVHEGNSPTTLTQDLLYEAREAVGKLRALLNKATGVSFGVSPVSGGVSTDNRARHLRKLASLSESVKENKRLIFFVDDVHKLAEPEVTRDFFRELSSTLGENVHLITAGRLTYDDADYTVHLGTFSREETADYLRQEYPDVDDDTVNGVYETLEGHPYYLGLLREAAGDESTFELPKEDARDFTERAYLDSMSEEEEEFIRKTSGLAELDEEICSSVLDDVSRTQSRRILDSLSTKTVVQEPGRSEDTGDRVFKVHDLFQEFLYEQLDNPEQLHREAFQYYAVRLYNEVEESEAPPLEGFVYGLMANIHLEEIYDGEPEIEELRDEIDRLELGPNERLQYIFGYGPYAVTPEEQSAMLLALELDDYTEWIRGLEPEDEGEELKIEFFGVMLDLMRATFRSNADIEFEESSVEIYESTIQRVEDFNFVAFFDEDEQEAAQIIPDMLRVCVHVAAHRDLEEGEGDSEHLVAAYGVLERYGLNRGAVEAFLDNWRELTEEYEAGEQAEEMIEGQMEEFLGQFDQGGATRNTLIRMQSDLYREMMELANSAFTAMISESDRLLEFIHECGDSLEQADNPFFVAAWYSFAAHVFRMFAPDADSTKELEKAAQHYAEVRMEYEEELENPIYEIEEFEVHDMDFPDLMNEIADSNGDPRLTE
jgi:MoxR-like ATPase